MFFLIKVVFTAVIVAGVSEFAKRSTVFGAVLASLPLTSILAMIWLYQESQSVEKVSELSFGIFWAVLPSLIFFLVLPFLLRLGVRFSFSLVLSCLVMFGAYTLYLWVLKKVGVSSL